MGLTILGLYLHNVVFFSLFVPVGTPLPLVPLLVLIELLSYSARAVSLGLRLAANTLSGHLLMSILGNLVKTFMGLSKITFIIGLLPIAGIFAIVILEFAIACIQAYVFAILTSSYLKD
ncbi:ATP synthase F0 subunit A, partial [Bacillus sp. OG2]